MNPAYTPAIQRFLHECGKTLCCFLTFLAISTLPLSAQQTTFFEEWVAEEESVFTEVQNELLKRVATVADGSGNLYVATSTFNGSTEVHDLLVTKYNSAGSRLWNQQYNISGGGDVLVGAITLDGSNNPIVTGAVFNGSNSYDALTVKYSTSGTFQWYALYNGNASHYDGGVSVTTDPSDNVYTGGVTTDSVTLKNYLTIKYNSSGSQQWASTYDGYGYNDAGARVVYAVTNVRNYGTTQENATDWSMTGVAYNLSTGAVITTLTFSPQDVVIEEINGFTTDGDGNIYVAGAVEADTTGLDFMTVKLDDELNVLWEAYTDSGEEGDDAAKAVAVDASGNVYVTGYATTTTNKDYMTVKYDDEGEELWTVFYNGAMDRHDEGTDIVVNSAGTSLFLTGFSDETGTTDFHTFWLDPDDGATLWDGRFNSVYNRDDRAAVIRMDPSGDLFVTGRTIALDSLSGEEVQVTTVKYKRTQVIIPPDEEAQSSAIHYIKNNGQLTDTDNDPVPGIKFYSESTYPGLYFFEDQLSMVLSQIDGDTSTVDTLHRVDVTFAGASRSYVSAMEERVDYFNYYLGHIPEGRERVPLFQRVIHHNAFEGIDIHYTSNAAGVKYDFVAAPGADPGDIGLVFDGQTGLSVNGSGELVIETSIGDIVLPEPVAYEIDGGEEQVLGWTPEYDMSGDTVRFVTDAYDDEKPLVIRIKREPEEPAGSDENCMWSTWVGAKLDDFGYDVDTDASGNVFVTGGTKSPEFPNTNGPVAQPTLNGEEFDAFVSMFTVNAELKWSTYYGGNKVDIGMSIVAANDGRVYFAGSARENFPTFKQPNTSPYFQDFYASPHPTIGHPDGFIVGLDLQGKRTWATYFGGYSDDEINKIVEDGNGNLIIGGKVGGHGYKFQNNSWQYLTIVATTEHCDEPTDFGFPYCATGTAFGQSTSSNDTGTGDVFIAKFNSDREMTWSTFFGGYLDENLGDIVVNPAGNSFYITGKTSSAGSADQCEAPSDGGFPLCDPEGTSYYQGTHPGAAENAFIAQFNAGNELVWSTYFGGYDHANRGYALALNSTGDLYVIGISDLSSEAPEQPAEMCQVPSNDAFPLCDPGGGAYFDDNDMVSAGKDLFISRFNTDKELTWSTYFGADGGDEENLDPGTGNEPMSTVVNAAMDAEDRLYLVGRSSGGTIPVLQKTGYYYHPTNSGNFDVFVAGFTTDNERDWVTYIEESELRDFGNAVALDRTNNKLYAVGRTESDNYLYVCPSFEPNPYCQGMWKGAFDASITRFHLDCMFTGVKSSPPQEFEVLIFPNPTNGPVTVSLPGGLAGDWSARIFNSMGQALVPTGNSSDNRFISLENQPSGIYFLRFSAGGKIFVKKVVKM